MKLKTLSPWKKSYDKSRQHIKKQRCYFANKGSYSQSYGFSSSLYGCKSWTIKMAKCQKIDAFELWCWRRSFSSAQSLSRVRLFVTPWTIAHQASQSITNSRSLLKLMSIRSVMPSNHLILCCHLLLLPLIFPSTRVFSSESVLRIRWSKYWSFSFSISPSNKYSELISFRIEWFNLLAVQGTPKSLL